MFGLLFYIQQTISDKIRFIGKNIINHVDTNKNELVLKAFIRIELETRNTHDKSL